MFYCLYCYCVYLCGKFHEKYMIMLQANELMVGDWVFRPACHDQVKEIRNTGVIGIDSMRGIVTFSELEPIPLTPEILARMGFTIEEEPKYDDTYVEDEYTAKIKCVDSRKCEVEIEYNTYWKKLRAFNYDPHNRLGFTSIETQVAHVHELQHIMRLCGIEKEFAI